MSAGNSQDPNRSSNIESNDAASSAAGKFTSSELLQKMLEATLMQDQSQLSAEEWSSLRATAIEAHATDLGLTEFVEALVENLLTLRFAKLKQDEINTQRLCHQIAVTLSGDPYTRQRLVEFQQHLLHPVT